MLTFQAWLLDWLKVSRLPETVGSSGRCVRMVAKSDEEARCNQCVLAQGGAQDCCSERLANRHLEGRPFSDLRAVAAWRPTADLPVELYRQRLREPLRPLAASPSFCSRWFFLLDLLRVMDCKGVAGLVAGGINIIFEV